jgi:hypothetical protein
VVPSHHDEPAGTGLLEVDAAQVGKNSLTPSVPKIRPLLEVVLPRIVSAPALRLPLPKTRSKPFCHHEPKVKTLHTAQPEVRQPVKGLQASATHLYSDPGSQVHHPQFSTSLLPGRHISVPFRPKALRLTHPLPRDPDRLIRPTEAIPAEWVSEVVGRLIVLSFSGHGFDVEFQPSDRTVKVEIDAYAGPAHQKQGRTGVRTHPGVIADLSPAEFGVGLKTTVDNSGDVDASHVRFGVEAKKPE